MTSIIISQGGQSHGQHDWVHGFPEPVKSFSWVCCSFPDYLEQLKKKNVKISAIGFTLQLFKVIWKTAANPGETLHSLVQKNTRGVLHFTA